MILTILSRIHLCPFWLATSTVIVALLPFFVEWMPSCEAWVTARRMAKPCPYQRQQSPHHRWPIGPFHASEPENQPYQSMIEKTTETWILSSAKGVMTHSNITTTTTTVNPADPASFLVPEQSVSLLDVGASITQESCPLLGVKSLGVDYGLVRTGLAVTVGYEPIPLAILQGNSDGATTWNATNVCAGVMEYAVSQQVQRIIVGLPLHKNGTIAGQTNVTLKFGAELTAMALRTLGPRVPVLFFDERYTSKEAEARAHSRNPGQGSLYGTLDAEAACIILENYYQDGGSGAKVLELPVDVRDECLRQFQLRQQEQERLRRQIQEERESRVQRRKDAMARALEEERIRSQSDEPTESRGHKAKKKKKKQSK